MQGLPNKLDGPFFVRAAPILYNPRFFFHY
jgi:hypothetical protein